jgi:osmoprotectant transport system permease protein
METLGFVWERREEVAVLTGQHLLLAVVSTSLAAAIGLPVGVVLTRYPALARPALGAVGVLQTIPSLALFGFLIPLAFIGGLGARSAVVAMVVYALLPIVRNTYTGLLSVDAAVVEAARGLGMTDSQLLRLVQIPLALPVILAGVRIATVNAIGLATIAAAIGAGGLGTFIFRGLAMVDHRLILAGAIPAALLALIADGGLGALENALVKR